MLVIYNFYLKISDYLLPLKNLLIKTKLGAKIRNMEIGCPIKAKIHLQMQE